MFNRKLGGKRRDDVGLSLHDLLHLRAVRSASQLVEQRPKLCGRADCINFHTAIREICGVAADAQSLGDSEREITVAYALHPARNVNAAGLLAAGHVIQEGSPKTTSVQFYQRW